MACAQHPTACETLFNWLLADIHGARVLDSCAGSGVLGFEALSRGAAHTTFIEVNTAQSNMLRQSAEQLRLDTAAYTVITGTAEEVLSQHQPIEHPFDIVFIDPPLCSGSMAAYFEYADYQCID
ncbi:hypothetical protein PKHYL_11840 [Psychrobacter sp. KH172YL61]|nr:RsmD family RNA methyltransferase [Psychrobacter sp. KH172YL61]BBI66993.1 hypothetical protein PKHYL_11840 [Psychrobacter sp. KH172YL61]